MGFLELNMRFLRFLEGHRVPAADEVMLAVTHFGEEFVFLAAALAVYWCVDKRKGHYLFLVGISGVLLNQVLKLAFCIPRPWELDPQFTIVEAAREMAVGFSFPSGHTQIAAGVFGGFACMSEKKWLRIPCIVLALTVAFSRMYLGVHTPLDVGVSLLVAAALVLAFRYAMEEAYRRPNYLIGLWSAMTAISGLYLLFTLFARSRYLGDGIENFDSAVKIGWSFVGISLSLVVSLLVDSCYTRFETDGIWWIQILKTVGGILFVLIVRALLKTPMENAFGPNSVGDGIRYFFMGLAGMTFWPITFRWLLLLEKKRNLQQV